MCRQMDRSYVFEMYFLKTFLECRMYARIFIMIHMSYGIREWFDDQNGFDHDDYPSWQHERINTNVMSVDIQRVLRNSGKYAKKCAHKGTRIASREDIPSAIFDMICTISLNSTRL